MRLKVEWFFLYLLRQFDFEVLPEKNKMHEIASIRTKIEDK